MDNKDIATVLYHYVVLGYSQQKIADTMYFNISQNEISNIVRDYGFNQSYTGSWQSGQDRGRYKTYKGMKVTENNLYNFVCSDYECFEDYLEDLYQDTIEHRRLEADRRRRQEEQRRRQAQQEYEWQQEQRRREEQRRLAEEERRRREQQQRLEEEAKKRQRQEQIDNKVHIQWMNTGIKYCEERNYTEALRYAEASYDLQPMYGNIYIIGKASYFLGQYERAYEMVDHLVKENEYKVTECRFIRAHIYKKISKGWGSDFIEDVEYLLEKKINVDDLLYSFANALKDSYHEEKREKAFEVYKLCDQKGIEVLNTNWILASMYYKRGMWQKTIDSYKKAEEACDPNELVNYIGLPDHWKLGICWYNLGDLGSAYYCFRNGLPLDYSKTYPQSEECLPTEEEEYILYDCLEKSGDVELLRYYKEELYRRKRFLNGKMTAYDFYGERYDGVNYRYFYNDCLGKWDQEIVEYESIGTKLLRWIRQRQ